MVLARKSVFHSGYFPGFFLFVVIILTIILYCTVLLEEMACFLFIFFLRVD